MSDPLKKSRMISIRVSEEEYEALRHSYTARGTRSLSELAREAMKQVLNAHGHAVCTSLESRVQTLEAQVMTLNQKLEKMNEAFDVHPPLIR